MTYPVHCTNPTTERQMFERAFASTLEGAPDDDVSRIRILIDAGFRGCEVTKYYRRHDAP